MKITVIAAGFEGRRRPNRQAGREVGDSGATALEDDGLDIPSFVQG